MPRTLTRTVRLEKGVLLSPKNKRWERQFKALSKEQQASVIASGAIQDVPDEDDEEEEEHFTLADLPAHLETVTDADEVRRMKKADKRVTAGPIYDARIKALETP